MLLLALNIGLVFYQWRTLHEIPNFCLEYKRGAFCLQYKRGVKCPSRHHAWNHLTSMQLYDPACIRNHSFSQSSITLLRAGPPYTVRTIYLEVPRRVSGKSSRTEHRICSPILRDVHFICNIIIFFWWLEHLYNGRMNWPLSPPLQTPAK